MDFGLSNISLTNLWNKIQYYTI